MRSFVGSRFLFIASAVVAFAGIAVDSPQAQATVRDYSYAYHGPGFAYLSRIRTTGAGIDTFESSASTGQSMYELAGHPSNINPSVVLAISPGSVGVRRIGPGNGTPVTVTGTTGSLQGAVYVNVPPLNPHYFVVGTYPSGSTHEFFDPHVSNINELFVHLGSGYAPTDAGFTRSTGGAFTSVNPAYRWFWTDKSPSGSTMDAIWCIDLRETDVLLAGATQDPWNPTPSMTTYGPPFPSLATQIGGTGSTGVPWGTRIKSMPLAGLDDDSHRIQTWTAPAGIPGIATGRNYLIVGRAVLLSSPPPVYGAMIDVYDADSATIPLTTAVISGFVAGSAGFPTVFHQIKVIGNYLFATSGANGSFKGGLTLHAWWIPRLVTGPPGPPSAPDLPAQRGAWPFSGATGIWPNVVKDKIYVGADDGSYDYAVGAVTPATSGLTVDAPSALVGAPATHLCLTTAEQMLITPPDRKWCGNDGIGIREDPNAFPGSIFGSVGGRKNKGGACSGSVLDNDSGGAIPAIAGLLLLIGLTGAILREAAKRA